MAPKLPSHIPNVLEAPLFSNIIKGSFIKRPNRFVVHCATQDGLIEAYLPNPGRLWELLLPGRILYLVKKEQGASSNLRHMVVAVERDERPVLLHTHLANAVAARLIEAKKIPGMEDATISRAEITVGRSRFDFLLQKGGKPFFLEVKSCTLFGRSIAMFPDAVTLRGKRHIEELVALSRQGTPCGIIFLVHWPQAEYFLPDYHTDLEFALAFKELKGRVFVKAMSLEWRPDLRLSENIREMSIPWEIIAEEARDGGDYLLLLHLAADMSLEVGSLGTVDFPQGYYLYVGTAKRALTKRLARHLRKNKTINWHMDYLRPYADRCTAIPIRSRKPLEHALAKALLDMSDWSIPAFGSSDCRCPTHLFGMKKNPLHVQAFIDLLQYFRIDRLEEDFRLW
ncbi:MAG TPA: DNA/RNA nuclease SfsA [Syntrophales bacterium]|nr:DNA/RNA nuclease SfsA [Syntrophales bacterium]